MKIGDRVKHTNEYSDYLEDEGEIIEIDPGGVRCTVAWCWIYDIDRCRFIKDKTPDLSEENISDLELVE